MSLHQGADRQPKSVTEHGVCFGTIAIVLMAAAFGIQWLLHLVP